MNTAFPLKVFPQHQISTALWGLDRGDRATPPLLRSRWCVPTSTPKPRAEGSSPSAPAKKERQASACLSFFVVTGGEASARGACRGALVAGGDRPAPTEPAGETSPSIYLHQAKEDPPSLSPLYSALSHPASPASNRSHPLQHPERTRFRLFQLFPGAFRHFCPLLTCKIFGLVFVHCADMSHRLKPSVIPCRREVSFLT